MPENYTINYLNLPYKIFGFTLYDGAEDYYTIYINLRHSYQEQKKAIKHELNHILYGDLLHNVDVNEIEFLR